MYKAIILLFIFLEGIITYLSFFVEKLEFSKFVILHLLITTIVYLIDEYKKINALIFHRLILTIPFIGVFLYFVSLILKKENDFHIVEDVFNMEKYLEEQKNTKTLELSEELKVISAFDIMNVEEEKEKKFFIINFSPKDIKTKVRMLRKGLLDKDIEIVHYSAVEINKISEKLNKQLRRLKKECLTDKSEEKFDEFINFYEKYLNTEILEGGILIHHQENYIKFLIDRLKKDEKLEYYLKLIKGYMELKKYEIAEKKCYALLNKGYDTEILYEKLVEINYLNENLEKLKEFHILHRENNIKMSKISMNIFKICGLEG
jgi:hypothetical protein